MQCKIEYDERMRYYSGRDEIVMKQNENKNKGDDRVTQQGMTQHFVKYNKYLQINFKQAW